MIKSQRADLEHEDNDDHELGEQMNDVFGSDIENLSYDPEPQVQENKKDSKKKFAAFNAKQMEKNL